MAGPGDLSGLTCRGSRCRIIPVLSTTFAGVRLTISIRPFVSTVRCRLSTRRKGQDLAAGTAPQLLALERKGLLECQL